MPYVKVLYLKKAKIYVEDLLRSMYGMQPGYVISNVKQVNSSSSSPFTPRLVKYVIREILCLQ